MDDVRDTQTEEEKFFSRLARLDPASRASLRHACGKGMNEAGAQALLAFYRCYPPKGYKEPIYFSLACMSCLNAPGHTTKKTTLERYIQRTVSKNDSLSARIVRLLELPYDAEDGLLANRLLDLLRMARKDGYEIDCQPLVRYLCHWNSDTQWVQKKLARACFGYSGTDPHEKT